MAFPIQACCHSTQFSSAAAPSRPAAVKSRILRASSRLLGASPVVFAFLLPKCPLCFAAWAAALGVGASWRHYLVYPWLRPLLIALLAVPLLIQLVFAARFTVLKLRGRPTSQQIASPPALLPVLLPHSQNQE